MHDKILDVEIVICKLLQFIFLLLELILLLQIFLLRLRLCNMQLYKFKLKFGNHIVEVWFAKGFSFVNDNIPMDIENLQMLQCIICRIE